MARIPCAFSVQEDILRQIDARAAQLGMKRSEFILQALRKELLVGGNSSMSIVAEPAKDVPPRPRKKGK
ncbi:MAG TPA: ribbon-helix-helix protein, CopG family [Candidatus Methylacidiphilales bacterium]